VKVSEIVELFGRYFQIGIYEKNLEASTLEETMNKKKSAFAVLLENRINTIVFTRRVIFI
jgi:hypothetical protein